MNTPTFRKSPAFRFISLTVLIAFAGMLPAQPSYAQVAILMPPPGEMIHITRHFEPPQMVGLKINLKDPFSFDFIMDQGETPMPDDVKKEEFNKIIKYFLVALAMPNREMWVNLSPYESSRIIPPVFAQTEMGRDLLAQDYILKQFTASLMYPENGLGKKFWSDVYAQAQARFGTTEINVNTFNKVWIMADHADIYQKDDTAFLIKSHLKVMLEQDYMAIEKNKEMFGTQANTDTAVDAKTAMASQVVREIIIPAIEKEVNEGKSFAAVRQAYNAEIMATWFKKTLRQSLLDQVFANKAKIAGQRISNPQAQMESIYREYLRAYKKGVFNYIREDETPDGQTIPRKYFSGGFDPVAFRDVNAYNANAMATLPVAERAMVAEETGTFAGRIKRAMQSHAGRILLVAVGFLSMARQTFASQPVTTQKSAAVQPAAAKNQQVRVFRDFKPGKNATGTMEIKGGDIIALADSHHTVMGAKPGVELVYYEHGKVTRFSDINGDGKFSQVDIHGKVVKGSLVWTYGYASGNFIPTTQNQPAAVQPGKVSEKNEIKTSKGNLVDAFSQRLMDQGGTLVGESIFGRPAKVFKQPDGQLVALEGGFGNAPLVIETVQLTGGSLEWSAGASVEVLNTVVLKPAAFVVGGIGFVVEGSIDDVKKFNKNILKPVGKYEATEAKRQPRAWLEPAAQLLRQLGIPVHDLSTDLADALQKIADLQQRFSDTATALENSKAAEAADQNKITALEAEKLTMHTQAEVDGLQTQIDNVKKQAAIDKQNSDGLNTKLQNHVNELSAKLGDALADNQALRYGLIREYTIIGVERLGDGIHHIVDEVQRQRLLETNSTQQRQLADFGAKFTDAQNQLKQKADDQQRAYNNPNQENGTTTAPTTAPSDFNVSTDDLVHAAEIAGGLVIVGGIAYYLFKRRGPGSAPVAATPGPVPVNPAIDELINNIERYIQEENQNLKEAQPGDEAYIQARIRQAKTKISYLRNAVLINQRIAELQANTNPTDEDKAKLKTVENNRDYLKQKLSALGVDLDSLLAGGKKALEQAPAANAPETTKKPAESAQPPAAQPSATVETPAPAQPVAQPPAPPAAANETTQVPQPEPISLTDIKTIQNLETQEDDFNELIDKERKALRSARTLQTKSENVVTEATAQNRLTDQMKTNVENAKKAVELHQGVLDNLTKQLAQVRAELLAKSKGTALLVAKLNDQLIGLQQAQRDLKAQGLQFAPAHDFQLLVDTQKLASDARETQLQKIADQMGKLQDNQATWRDKQKQLASEKLKGKTRDKQLIATLTADIKALEKEKARLEKELEGLNGELKDFDGHLKDATRKVNARTSADILAKAPIQKKVDAKDVEMKSVQTKIDNLSLVTLENVRIVTSELSFRVVNTASVQKDFEAQMGKAKTQNEQDLILATALMAMERNVGMYEVNNEDVQNEDVQKALVQVRDLRNDDRKAFKARQAKAASARAAAELAPVLPPKTFEFNYVNAFNRIANGRTREINKKLETLKLYDDLGLYKARQQQRKAATAAETSKAAANKENQENAVNEIAGVIKTEAELIKAAAAAKPAAPLVPAVKELATAADEIKNDIPPVVAGEGTPTEGAALQQLGDAAKRVVTATNTVGQVVKTEGTATEAALQQPLAAANALDDKLINDVAAALAAEGTPKEGATVPQIVADANGATDAVEAIDAWLAQMGAQPAVAQPAGSQEKAAVESIDALLPQAPANKAQLAALLTEVKQMLNNGDALEKVKLTVQWTKLAEIFVPVNLPDADTNAINDCRTKLGMPLLETPPAPEAAKSIPAEANGAANATLDFVIGTP